MAHSSHQGLTAGEIAAADFDAVIGEKGDLDAQIAQSEQALESARAELEALTGTDDIPDILSLDGRMLGTRTLTLDLRRIPASRWLRPLQKAPKLLQPCQTFIHACSAGWRAGAQAGPVRQPLGHTGGPAVLDDSPSEARNTPIVMKEVKAMGAAERDAVLAQRQVIVEYRRTRASLASALTMLRHSNTAQQALDARASDLEHAWSVGETPVIEYLRARRAALDAGQRRAEADVIWHAAMIRMSLMAGHYP